MDTSYAKTKFRYRYQKPHFRMDQLKNLQGSFLTTVISTIAVSPRAMHAVYQAHRTSVASTRASQLLIKAPLDIASRNGFGSRCAMF